LPSGGKQYAMRMTDCIMTRLPSSEHLFLEKAFGIRLGRSVLGSYCREAVLARIRSITFRTNQAGLRAAFIRRATFLDAPVFMRSTATQARCIPAGVLIGYSRRSGHSRRMMSMRSEPSQR